MDVRLKSGKTITGALCAHTTGAEADRDLLLGHHDLAPVLLWEGHEATVLTTADGQRRLVVVNAAGVDWITVGQSKDHLRRHGGQSEPSA